MLVCFASSSALACTGSEACGMPCCRSSSNDCGHKDPGAGPPNGCDASGAGATVCSQGNRDVASSHAVQAGFSVPPATVEGADALPADHARTRHAGRAEEKLPLKTPRYLQIHILLI